jgi:hypothetical protein
MRLLPVVLILSKSLRPSEILIGGWDVFKGVDSTPVGYFECLRKQSPTPYLNCTVWETRKPGPATHDTNPMLEQAFVTFTSDNSGIFTTLHDKRPIRFFFSDGRHVAFVVQRGSFEIMISSNDSIEIRSQDGYRSFLAVRQEPVVISEEPSRVNGNWPAALVLIVAILLLFTLVFWLRKRRRAGDAAPRVKSE